MSRTHALPDHKPPSPRDVELLLSTGIASLWCTRADRGSVRDRSGEKLDDDRAERDAERQPEQQAA